MLYMPLELAWVYHYYTCKAKGHIKHEWEGYLGDVGQRCKAKNGEDPGLPPLRDKSVRAWLPKADKHCLMVGQVPTLIFWYFLSSSNFKKYFREVAGGDHKHDNNIIGPIGKTI